MELMLLVILFIALVFQFVAYYRSSLQLLNVALCLVWLYALLKALTI